MLYCTLNNKLTRVFVFSILFRMLWQQPHTPPKEEHDAQVHTRRWRRTAAMRRPLHRRAVPAARSPGGKPSQRRRRLKRRNLLVSRIGEAVARHNPIAHG